ncbi:polysaccharide pyruvyl transferase family protein [Pelagovum sp. HNIBRBA483]|uniref:polysaccharide pyruvyl transferase family protein n=1 Tax=Pelagovum sp. HNIBRBA483 TaxID=3233341 RepID=UPI0034A265A5
MKPIIEVKGIAFPNKGAEMLLVACIDQLERRGCYAALEPYSPFEYKLRYPLFTKARIQRFGVNILSLLNLLPRYARERLGYIRPSELALALDASGFAYGAPWPVSIAYERLLGEKLSCPVVMLPQSWGKFDTLAQMKVAKVLNARAALVFAREPEGADNFEKATGKRPLVVPDITFGVTVSPAEISRDVLFIPNFQVERREGADYIETLIDAARSLLIAGRQVALLNHEGPKDLEICYRVRDRLVAEGFDVKVLDPETGLEAKAIIGAARFVVTSRYHGLIAALSQGVACYPVGWSYKYVSAMHLFGIEIEESVGHPEHVSDRAMSAEYCDQFQSAAYIARLDEIRDQVVAMWDQVFALIRS